MRERLSDSCESHGLESCRSVHTRRPRGLRSRCRVNTREHRCTLDDGAEVAIVLEPFDGGHEGENVATLRAAEAVNSERRIRAAREIATRGLFVVPRAVDQKP